MGGVLGLGIELLRSEVTALMAELKILLGKTGQMNLHVGFGWLLVGLFQPLFDLQSQFMSAVSTFFANIYLGLLAVVNSTIFILRLVRLEKIFNDGVSGFFGLLHDPVRMGYISTLCSVALLILLYLGTQNVDVDSLQFEYAEDEGYKPSENRGTASETQRRLSQRMSQRVSIFGEVYHEVSPVKLSIPSDASWKEVSKRRIQTPKSRWITGGSASFFSRLRGNRSKSSSASSSDDYKLSTAGLKRWSPDKVTLSPSSPAGSIAGSGTSPEAKPRTSSTESEPRRKSKTMSDPGFGAEISTTDDGDDGGHTPRSLPRRSLTFSGNIKDAFDPRSVIGWEVMVKGYGTGIVKDVRKSLLFGKRIFDIDFGTGKLTKVSVKNPSNRDDLPFTLIRRAIP